MKNYTYVFTFFTFFFENPRKHGFLRFFELLYTFSRTLIEAERSHAGSKFQTTGAATWKLRRSN